MAVQTLRTLNPDDQAALEAFLRPRVVSSMFLLSNMRKAGLHDSGQPYTGTYAAAFDGRQIVAVVAHYWNQNLIFQAPLLATELYRIAAAAAKRPIKGLIGPADQVHSALASLPSETIDLQVDETEKLYMLALDGLIEPAALQDGRVQARQAAAHDLDLLIQWRVDYSIETMKERDTPQLHEQSRDMCERALHEGTMWLLEDQGQPVACSAFNAVIAEAVQVGGVWTPQSLRARGYARAVVAASLRWARAAGKTTALLFTGEQNLPAQRAYEALGFQQIGAYRMAFLEHALTM